MADEQDDGIKAISAVLTALRPLDEKTRLNVLDFVLKQLGMPVGSVPSRELRASTIANQGDLESPRVEQKKLVAITDIRSLAEQKKPKTVNERVAVVAYYLKNLAPEEERRDFITAEDVGNYFPQADFELPVARMALTNAKNAGYLNTMTTGKYRLNPVGHNLVSHKLPSDEVTPKFRKRRTALKKAQKRR